MANKIPRVPVREQDPKVRATNFEEVCYGYNVEEATLEASRCLNCKNPRCVAACPVNIRIPDFIHQVVEGNFAAAAAVISEDSSLPSVCGRVCPQESQCEMHCVRGKKGDPVGIGRLERFVADWHNAHSTEAPEKPQPNGHKVAVVGSGPAGLTCAGDLAKKGYDVTVFEALHLAGGVLVYGIPEFRLPKAIVQKEVDGLKALGVKVETNMVIGRVVSIDELMSEYGFEAVFIGSGAGLPMFMHIPGENLCGVYSANEFLTRINLMKAYREDSDTPIMDLKGKTVAVVGGGNSGVEAAIDLAGIASSVVLLQRGSELTADKVLQEKLLSLPNVTVKYRACTSKLTGSNKLEKLFYLNRETGETESIDADGCFVQIGLKPNTEWLDGAVELNAYGEVAVSDRCTTSAPGLFAAGDCTSARCTRSQGKAPCTWARQRSPRTPCSGRRGCERRRRPPQWPRWGIPAGRRRRKCIRR